MVIMISQMKLYRFNKKKDIKCIKGNHDKYLLNELPYDLKKDGNLWNKTTKRVIG
ncbi:hypothetical protein MASR2M54_12490 [Aliarcobacter cryaerophilus]